MPNDGLHPSAATIRKERVDRELPFVARKWGRMLDLSALEPGDLLLFRPAGPQLDKVSAWIVDAQIRGGLAARDARWTHAAVYLGDGEHLCEANIGITGFPNGVVMRSAHAYCDEQHIIRARRPSNMSANERLRVAFGALNRLQKGYSRGEAFQFWRAAFKGEGMWSQVPYGPRFNIKALVCSTLYQDALTFASHGSTVRLGRMCTPAHLSASTEFDAVEPTLNWVEIE